MALGAVRWQRVGVRRGCIAGAVAGRCWASVPGRASTGGVCAGFGSGGSGVAGAAGCGGSGGCAGFGFGGSLGGLRSHLRATSDPGRRRSRRCFDWRLRLCDLVGIGRWQDSRPVRLNHRSRCRQAFAWQVSASCFALALPCMGMPPFMTGAPLHWQPSRVAAAARILAARAEAAGWDCRQWDTSMWPPQYKAAVVGRSGVRARAAARYFAGVDRIDELGRDHDEQFDLVRSRLPVLRNGTPMIGMSEMYGKPRFWVSVRSCTRPARANVWPAFISTAVSTWRTVNAGTMKF